MNELFMVHAEAVPVYGERAHELEQTFAVQGLERYTLLGECMKK